jgi:hypothetical protein
MFKDLKKWILDVKDFTEENIDFKLKSRFKYIKDENINDLRNIILERINK